MLSQPANLLECHHHSQQDRPCPSPLHSLQAFLPVSQPDSLRVVRLQTPPTRPAIPLCSLQANLHRNQLDSHHAILRRNPRDNRVDSLALNHLEDQALNPPGSQQDNLQVSLRGILRDSRSQDPHLDHQEYLLIPPVDRVSSLLLVPLRNRHAPLQVI